MKLSRNWLKEFVEIDADDKTFAEAMTLSGSKVETTEDLGAEIQNVVVGKVVEIKRHENSDHMWICQVDVGDANRNGRTEGKAGRSGAGGKAQIAFAGRD